MDVLPSHHRTVKRTLKPAGALIALVVAMLTAHGADVRVLDPDGHPVAGAAVVCLGREKGVDSSGPDGSAHVPDACRRVHCEIGDFVPAQAVIVNGKAECRLTAGVFVTAAPVPTSCVGEHACSAAIRRFGGGISESDSVRLDDPFWPPGVIPRSHFRFKAVPPGRYRFQMQRTVGLHDLWECEADLGTLAAGDVEVQLRWTDPVRVAVRAPRPGLTVVVARRLSAADTPGTWACSRPDYLPPIVTGADGTAAVFVDPARPFVIELREEGQDAALARREFDAVPTGVVQF
jgi:hypothetical protein